MILSISWGEISHLYLNLKFTNYDYTDLCKIIEIPSGLYHQSYTLAPGHPSSTSFTSKEPLLLRPHRKCSPSCHMLAALSHLHYLAIFPLIQSGSGSWRHRGPWSSLFGTRWPPGSRSISFLQLDHWAAEPREPSPADSASVSFCGRCWVRLSHIEIASRGSTSYLSI